MISKDDICSMGYALYYVDVKNDIVFQWQAFHTDACKKDEIQQFVTILNIVNKANRLTKVINDITKHMNINGFSGVCDIYKS